MNGAVDSQFFIAWKGARTGPFTLAEIREKLVAGEVSRMHQVQAGQRWLSVDELIAEQENSERQTAKAHEDRIRQEYETRLSAERAEARTLAEKLEASERRVRLLPSATQETPKPLPAPQNAVAPPPPVRTESNSSFETSRTNGYAVTAFICSLCNFIPFLNFVSWIPAIVFGHVALRDLKADPSQAGRGLAIAALCITYFLLILGITVGVLTGFSMFTNL